MYLVGRIHKADFEKMVFDKEYREQVFLKNVILDQLEDTEEQQIHPLNQILYGPPGTGKTYNTINKALSIIENKSIESLKAEERSDLKVRFKKYVDSGQIAFTTFHQSMSYEDFVEGIKPLI